MAGAYLEIPVGRSYSFTSNVATRLSNISANMVGATLFFMAKANPEVDSDAQAIITATPTANTTTNVVTVALAQNSTTSVQNVLFWELSMLTSGNSGYYTLDHGRMAVVKPVRS